VDFRGAPRLRVDPEGEGEGGGSLQLRLGRDVRIEPGTRLQVRARADNSLALGDRAALQDGVRIWLLGGSIAIGKGAIVRDQSVLKSGGELTIGEFVRIGYATVIHCHEQVELAARSVLADLVVIVDSDHVHDGSDSWVMAQGVLAAPVRVGANTLVGASTVITRGTLIGPNSIVAAGAVVRAGGYPASSLIGGIPARQLRSLGGDD
jgi:acetyltransferase-like isoleucine patch superfamily enzyme